MSELSILTVDPLHPEAVQLVEQLSAELAPFYGGNGSGAFTPADVQIPRAAFVLARLGGRPVGCAALRPFADDAGAAEVKRMYVLPDSRGRGVARQMLGELERLAREFGFATLRLETGDRQHEAIRLYERAGYVRIPCYGIYVNSSWSICFEKRLAS